MGTTETPQPGRGPHPERHHSRTSKGPTPLPTADIGMSCGHTGGGLTDSENRNSEKPGDFWACLFSETGSAGQNTYLFHLAKSVHATGRRKKKFLRGAIANRGFIQNGQKSTTLAYYAPLCRRTLGRRGFLDRGPSRLLDEQCHARLLA